MTFDLNKYGTKTPLGEKSSQAEEIACTKTMTRKCLKQFMCTQMISMDEAQWGKN